MKPRIPLVVLGGVAVTLPFLACNALKKSEAAGDAGVAPGSASALAASASASGSDTAVAGLVDAAPPRYVAPATTAPKPDPDSCKQARALRASGNPAWQKLVPQCTAQGGKI